MLFVVVIALLAIQWLSTAFAHDGDVTQYPLCLAAFFLLAMLTVDQNVKFLK